jgi:GNAT superfamily N-acetyltransferase
VPGDAPNAVPLILQAIGSIAFVLTGTTDPEEASSILSDFFGQEQHRVSYENALVLEEDGKLVEAACDHARRLGHRRIALLVEADSPGPRRLYERLGFRVDYTKRIAGQEYFHMVRNL